MSSQPQRAFDMRAMGRYNPGLPSFRNTGRGIRGQGRVTAPNKPWKSLMVQLADTSHFPVKELGFEEGFLEPSI